MDYWWFKANKTKKRLSHASKTPGKIKGDHAGHLAGDRFGGSSKVDNLVSQSRDVNLSKYKKIENEWARSIKKGKKVSVNLEVKYSGDDLRPTEFHIQYTIDGNYHQANILNWLGGKNETIWGLIFRDTDWYDWYMYGICGR